MIAIIPMILYGAFYVGNILINGVGTGPNRNDWYGFTMFGLDKIWLVYLVVTLATWMIARGLCTCSRAVLRRMSREDKG